MTLRNLLKIGLLAFLTLYCSFLRADDYKWASDDQLLSLVAVPVYDQQSHALTSVVVTFSDYTVGASAKPPKKDPYVYPAPQFTFPFTPPSAASPQQNVAAVPGSSTVNGTMEFRPLQSSKTSTFLFVNLLYGTDIVQTRSAQGSVLEVPLVSSGP